MKKSIFERIICMLFLSLLSGTAAISQTPYHKDELGYGKWSKSWYADEFGDPMYDKPYIQTELKRKWDNYTWDFFYIRFVVMPENMPVFEIILSQNGVNGNTKMNLYDGKATIKIKSANGAVSSITAPVSGGNIYIVKEDVMKFAKLIDAGNYKLSVSAHCYLDDYGNATTWNFSCTNETIDFFKAVRTGLKYTF